MWTSKNRERYDRSELRYPSDLSDDEWAHIEPLIPPAKRGGRRREVDMREVVNGIMYVLSTGCQWRYAIPKDLPPRSTLHRLLRSVELRRNVGAHSPCAVPEVPRTGGTRREPHGRHHRQPEREERRKRGARIDPHGYDAGKKIKGKKRHVLVDTLGLLLHAVVHPADVQDRDGGILLLSTLFGIYPFLEKAVCRQPPIRGRIFERAASRKSCRSWKPKSSSARTRPRASWFCPRRWIVERSIAWLNRCRRLAKDWENLNRKALAFLAPRLNPPYAAQAL